MKEENWRKKRKKYVDHVREKGETKLVRELVSEYYSSKFMSIFPHQTFLVKVVRLLRVIFSCFYQIDSPK
jgi:hypothetical protein